MYSTKIKSLYTEHEELIEFCRTHEQVSFEMYIDDTYKKSLLLSAASYFETVITNAIIEYVKNSSRNNEKLIAFVENKALKRQYHTFFKWEEHNSNSFWGLFGAEFKTRVREEIKTRALEDAERAFLAIGNERNCLVHRNYVEADVNYTFDEIYKKYEQACDFVEFLIEMLNT